MRRPDRASASGRRRCSSVTPKKKDALFGRIPHPSVPDLVNLGQGHTGLTINPRNLHGVSTRFEPAQEKDGLLVTVAFFVLAVVKAPAFISAISMAFGSLSIFQSSLAAISTGSVSVVR